MNRVSLGGNSKCVKREGEKGAEVYNVAYPGIYPLSMVALGLLQK